MHIRTWAATAAVVFAAVLAAQAQAVHPPAAEVVLQTFADRMPALKAEIPVIVKAAEAAAAQRVQHPGARLMISREPDLGFAYELTSRAGGFADISHERPGWRSSRSSNDVVLVSMPTWQGSNDTLRAGLVRVRERGGLVIAFGARAGRPADFPADFVIDNGAPSDSAEGTGMNTIANAAAAWLWCCEYTAALTRLGRQPPVLKSKLYADGDAFNTVLRSDPVKLHDFTGVPIAPRALADLYLARLETLVRDMAAEDVRASIERAVRLAAGQIEGGRAVYAATCTHLLAPAIFRDNLSAIAPFRPYDDGFEKTLKPGDLLVWLGYMGMDTANYQHGADIRKTGADFIACFAPSAKGDQEAPDAKVIVPQSWGMGDAEIPIPFAPDRMAPVSGINVALLWRMIDAGVAAAQSGNGPVRPAPEGL